MDPLVCPFAELQQLVKSLLKTLVLVDATVPMHRLWRLSADIKMAVVRYGSWVDQQTGGTGQEPEDYSPDLLADLSALVDCEVPAIVEKAVHFMSMSEQSSTTCQELLLGNVVNVLAVLQLQRSRGAPHVVLQPRLIRAVLGFSGRLGSLDLEQTEVFVALLTRMTVWLSVEDARLQLVSPALFSELCDMVSHIFQLCREPPSDLLCSLLVTIMLLRHTQFTMPRPRLNLHVRRTLDASHHACLSAGRLVIVALSRRSSSVLAPCLHPLFAGLLSMEMTMCAVPPCVRTVPGDSEYIRALFKVSAKHPELAACKIVTRRMQMHTFAPVDDEEASIWITTISGCLRRTLQRMQERRPLTLLLPEAEAASMAIQELFIAESTFEPHRPWLGLSKFMDGLSMKGGVLGLEALLRSTGFIQTVNETTDATFLVTPFAALQLMFSRESMTLADMPFPQLLSLAITARKLVLSVSHSALQPFATILVQAIMEVLGKLDTQDRSIHLHEHRHRMYLVLATTLQPILRIMHGHVDIDPVWHLELLHPVPDCDADPVLWQGVVEDFAAGHDARLLPKCGNLECVNMASALDSLLKTRRCSGCRRISYCSNECQQSDWGFKGCRHGRVCGKGWWSASES